VSTGRVDYVASRELADLFTWWIHPLGIMNSLAWLGITVLAAFGLSSTMGALEQRRAVGSVQ
jgi:hypothetical protein